MSARIAPGRSRHQPFGREPITFIPSTIQRVMPASALAPDIEDDERDEQQPGGELGG